MLRTIIKILAAPFLIAGFGLGAVTLLVLTVTSCSKLFGSI